MGRQKRKILLSLDNAPSHANITLDNIQLKFFPPNTILKLQPMDQGIIQTVKLKYRKCQLWRILQELEQAKEATGIDIAKRTNILDAIHWISAAWAETQPDTTTKCFYKAGFTAECSGKLMQSYPWVTVHLSFVATDVPTKEKGERVADHTEEVDQDMDLLIAQELYGCSFESLPCIDEELLTCNTDRMD